MASRRKVWWCLSWKGKRLGIWLDSYGGCHHMWLYKTKAEALLACEDWDPSPSGPKPKKITIVEWNK